jgi:hypothetical protein
LGAGIVFHNFLPSDEIHEKNQLFIDGNDKIKSIDGYEFIGEYFFNKDLSLGCKYQDMYGGYTETDILVEMERLIKIQNYILYMNAALSLTDSNYWKFGGSLGLGFSKYEHSIKYTGIDISNYNKSANGIILPVGIFLDFGEDGFGGRLGINYILSKYSKIDNVAPKASGYQIYLNIRYGI